MGHPVDGIAPPLHPSVNVLMQLLERSHRVDPQNVVAVTFGTAVDIDIDVDVGPRRRGIGLEPKELSKQRLHPRLELDLLVPFVAVPGPVPGRGRIEVEEDEQVWPGQADVRVCGPGE